MMHAYWGPRRWRVSPEHFNGGRRMPIEVRAEDDGYLLRASVPGRTADEVQVEVLEDLVILKTVPSDEQQDQAEGRSLLNEIDHSGGSYRRIRLPEPVEADQVQAKLENGLLTVRLPKSEARRTKRIAVSGK